MISTCSTQVTDARFSTSASIFDSWPRKVINGRAHLGQALVARKSAAHCRPPLCRFHNLSKRSVQWNTSHAAETRPHCPLWIVVAPFESGATLRGRLFSGVFCLPCPNSPYMAKVIGHDLSGFLRLLVFHGIQE